MPKSNSRGLWTAADKGQENYDLGLGLNLGAPIPYITGNVHRPDMEHIGVIWTTRKQSAQ